MTRWIMPALLAATALPSAALADHLFILPSSTIYSGDGNMVTFDAAGSDHVFFFDHRPLDFATVKITKPDGSAATPSNALKGRFRSVFDLSLDQQGTWRLASTQTSVSGSFKVDGQERRVGGRGGFGGLPGASGAPGGQPGAGGNPAGQGGEGRRGAQASADGQAPAGGQGGRDQGGPGQGGEGGRSFQPPVAVKDIPVNATDVHLTETTETTETFVTQGAPTPIKTSGKGLEFDPITHPNAIAQGETARFRFLVDGKPTAGVKVTVVPGGDRYRDKVGEMNFTSGADGVVAIKWPTAGMYWLGAEAEDKHPSEARADTRRMNYSATLEVMTP